MERLKNYLKPDDFYLLKHELKGYSINWDEVVDYIESLDLTKIRVKSPYIRNIILNEITTNNRWIKEISVEPPQFLFHEYWAKYPLVMDDKSKYFYEQLVDFIYGDGCPLEELQQITDLIPTMVQTSQEAYEMLKRSKLIKKYNVNLEAVESKATEDYEQWEKLLKELDGIK